MPCGYSCVSYKANLVAKTCPIYRNRLLYACSVPLAYIEMMTVQHQSVHHEIPIYCLLFSQREPSTTPTPLTYATLPYQQTKKMTKVKILKEKSSPPLLLLEPRDSVHARLHLHAEARVEDEALPSLDLLQVLLALAHLVPAVRIDGRLRLAVVLPVLARRPALRAAALAPRQRGKLVVRAGERPVVTVLALVEVSVDPGEGVQISL